MSIPQRIAREKHAAEIGKHKGESARLQRRLDVALDTIAQMRAARAFKIPKAHKRPRLRGDEVRVILNDVHGAKMDRAAVAAALQDVKTLSPSMVILNGDIVDCGGFLAQHHTLGYVAETTDSYSDDIAAANGFLDGLRLAAPNARIEYVEGNHEQRVERWCVTETLRHQKDSEMLRRLVAPEFLLHLKERETAYYRISECYDGLTVPGFIKRGKCFYTHASFITSKHATKDVQAKIAGNVVFANTHREQAERVSRVSAGIIGAWNPGCLCQLQPLWQNTNPTDWSHGIGVQFVSRTGNFLHLNVPILGGESLLMPLLNNPNHNDAS